MYQVETSTAVSIRPANPAPGTPGWFSAGNPGTGTPATKPGFQWFNRVTAEFKNAIEGAGLTLDPDDDTQLFQAIAALIAAGISGISAKQKRLVVETAVFETGVADGHPVRWNSATSKWDRAYADGTANNLVNGIADVTNSEVTIYGETPAGLVTGLTAGSRYYLTAAGALSTVMAPDVVKMGIAKSATVFWVDIDQSKDGSIKVYPVRELRDVNVNVTCAAGGVRVGLNPIDIIVPVNGAIRLQWVEMRAEYVLNMGMALGMGIEIVGDSPRFPTGQYSTNSYYSTVQNGVGSPTILHGAPHSYGGPLHQVILDREAWGITPGAQQLWVRLGKESSPGYTDDIVIKGTLQELVILADTITYS